jgi:type IV pilus assembly protein PilB
MSAMNDLPAPPLLTGQMEVKLAGSAVSVHLMDGEEMRGGLEHFDLDRAQFSITPDAGGDSMLIPFSKLRYLIFSAPLSPPDITYPLEQKGLEIRLPADSQPFKIVFNDGKELSGRTRSFIVDEFGLHFFQVGTDSRIRRIFVPSRCVSSYRVGAEIKEVLAQERTLTKDILQSGVEAQQPLRAKKIGEYLVDSAQLQLTTLDLQRALVQQATHPDEKFGEILVKNGLISRLQLNEALTAQKRDRTKSLGDILVEAGAVKAEVYFTLLAHNLGLPFVKLQKFNPDPSVLAQVDADFARKHMLVPLMMLNHHLVVAMADPTDHDSINLLRFTSGHNIEVSVAARNDLEWAITKYYGAQDAPANLQELEMLVSEQPDDEKTIKAAEHQANLSPLVKLANDIISEAIRRRASDIHIRPAEKYVDILYRIDGDLVQIRQLPKVLLAALISRIKIVSRMDIAEKRLPQDGQMRVSFGGSLVDLRISVMPTVTGESMVIRILNTKTGLKSIAELGFSEHDQAIFTDLLHKSYGMLLVTGPTGSGKSTTLYAALNEIRKQNINIITVENPVEYHIEGIMQIQVKSEIGYTFAEALRHILRHDPDAILIGEIRDQETAQIAIKSALTGHLVLSTLHTNNAAGAITRLKDMGAESYLLSSTLLAVLAQRLIRRNCPQCTAVEKVEPAIRKILGVAEDEVFYRGGGCEACNHSGYSGRLAVYELLLVTPVIQRMIITGESTEEIHRQAVTDGMVPLTSNALTLARTRSTSLAEVYRVRLE